MDAIVSNQKPIIVRKAKAYKKNESKQIRRFLSLLLLLRRWRTTNELSKELYVSTFTVYQNIDSLIQLGFRVEEKAGELNRKSYRITNYEEVLPLYSGEDQEGLLQW